MYRRIAAFFVLMLGAIRVFAVDAKAPQTLRYTIVSNGKVTGSEVDTFGPNHQIDCAFEFNDRGRGPKVTARYVVDKDGMPVRLDISGNDYFKAKVDEHRSSEAGRAHWQSTSEKGSSEVAGFYISQKGLQC